MMCSKGHPREWMDRCQNQDGSEVMYYCPICGSYCVEHYDNTRYNLDDYVLPGQCGACAKLDLSEVEDVGARYPDGRVDYAMLCLDDDCTYRSRSLTSEMPVRCEKFIARKARAWKLNQR